MSTDASSANPLVAVTHALEQDSALDAGVDLLAAAGRAVTDRPVVHEILTGAWLGHSLHPPLTDLPLGAWMSASMLDLLGPEGSEDAATRLVGIGLLGALPTALSGLADWRSLSKQTDRRVGVVHAVGNSAALAAYTGSWVARRKGKHRLGVLLGLAGAALSGGAGYLGGHLVAHGTFEG